MAAVSTSELHSIPKLALILIGANSILWGLNWPAMKFVVGELEPWTFRSLCVYGAGLTLLAIAKFNGENLIPKRKEIPQILVIALFGVTAWHMLTAFGLSYIGGGRGAIIAFTMPLWAMILSVLLLNEKLNRRRLIALFCGMLGIALLMLDSFHQLGNAPIGTFLIGCAAISWACSTVGTKAFSWNLGTIALSGWLLVIGGIPILLIWLINEAPGDFSKFSPTGAMALFYVTFVSLVFCFTAYLRIITLLPASIAAISTLAIPVVGVISSALLLHEPIGKIEWSSLVLVLCAIGLVLWPTKSLNAE